MLSGGLREVARAALDAIEARLFPPLQRPEPKPRALSFELVLQGHSDQGVPFMVNERFQYFRAGSVHTVPIDVKHLLAGANVGVHAQLTNVCLSLIGEAVIRGVEGYDCGTSGQPWDTAVRSLTLPVVQPDQVLRVKVHVAPMPAKVHE